MSDNLPFGDLHARDRRPLPLVVRDAVLRVVTERHLMPGDRLPPEPALAKMLAVSRPTLREAIHTLETEGVLVRARGVGTFIAAAPLLRNNLNVNFGVTDLIRSKGHAAGTLDRVVRIQVVTGAMCAALGLETATKVMTIDRVRTADGRPVVLSTDVIPMAIVPSGEASQSGIGESLYEWLRDRCGVAIHHGVARIKPVVARGTLTRRLRVRPGSPLLLLEQVDYTANGRPVLLSLEYHVPDAFEITVHRAGPGGS
jgi:GntR family transcriptional regulator